MKKKVLLAYSGGLDTTYCACYLSQLGYEVHTLTVNTGGFGDEELAQLSQSAESLGIQSHHHVDVTATFYDQCLRFLLASNYLKNQTYPLSVSAERFFQAYTIAKYAKANKMDAVAHGSTGAGNDQVRFDMVFEILCPEVEIITPVRDQSLSREEEISYLKAAGITRDWEQSKYSINKGIWGTSVGGQETLTSENSLPEEAFPTQVTATGALEIAIGFEKGNPVSLNGERYCHPIELISKLAEIAGPYGIGRDIHVGDTIIGTKGRVGFEAPAPLILIKAHHALEKHVLTKNQIIIKDQLAQHYGHMIHEGQFLDPVMRNMEAFLEDSQKSVDGEVKLQLAPHRFHVLGVVSEKDLMAADEGKYGEATGSWNGDHVKGFTKIYAHQTKLFHKVNADE